MQIPDLSYLESVPEDELILGSAGVNVTAEAFAVGSDSSPFASANTSIRAFVSNDLILQEGSGTAGAVGDNPRTNVTVEIKKPRFKFSAKPAVSKGFTISRYLPLDW
jgi:hypothetical protein